MWILMRQIWTTQLGPFRVMDQVRQGFKVEEDLWKFVCDMEQV